MTRIEMRASDLCELYILLEMYGQTYGTTEGIRDLTEAVKAKCREQGITEIRNSRKAGRPKTITAEQDAEIMNLRAAGKTIRAIAAETGVSRAYVHQLISGHMK